MGQLVAVFPQDGWDEEAGCKGVNTRWFFCDKDSSVEFVKQVCNTLCPVKEECLKYSLHAGEWFGTWGGFSESERWEMAKEIHGTTRKAMRGCKCSPCRDALKIKQARAKVMNDA